MEYMEKLSSTKKELDSISPSFCLAKWLQVTLHLQNGFNHSCHHPEVHQITLDDLKNGPSSLHNTAYKKNLWAAMKKGNRPKECDFCWKVEDSAGHHFSDRILKSSDPWAHERMQEIANTPAKKNVNPSYVEVSFSHECNFRCSYCNPYTSSSIWAQYAKHGPYIGRASVEEIERVGRKPFGKEEPNPYVNAFWEWFPELSRSLRVFRITGGEPLLNRNTFQVLDFIEKNPLPELELCINSNLGVPDKFIDEFLEKVSLLTKDGKLKKFRLYTSVDTHGAQAEYLRVGLNYERWLRNVKKYLKVLPWPVTFMVTFNLLSLAKFELLLNDMVLLNSEFEGEKNFEDEVESKRALIDITHLRHPDYFSPWILPPSWREKMGSLISYMESRSIYNIGAAGFLNYETHKMQRIKSWMDTEDHDSFHARFHRGRFFLFTKQFEERENRRFLDVFPEMEDFFLLCQTDAARFTDNK